MDILNKIDLFLDEKSDSGYKEFFKKKLKKWKIKNPSELSKENRIKFFNEIEKEWKED
jgi:hypothetical protein